MIEHKTVSLADQVFEHLEKDILSGNYQRGDILTETKLSQELGVSRTPIREALRRLEQEHIIAESGKGCIVIGITDKDLKDIYEIRTALECLASAKAAKNRTEEQLSELKEALDLQEFYLKKGDAEQIKKMDNRFHNTIYLLSGSTVFCDTLIPLHKKIQKYRRASVENHSRAVDSVNEHKRIYEAIAAGDADAAQKYTTEHIRNAFNHIAGKD